MASCPFGKASLVFPLSITGNAALGALPATEGAPAVRADVIGYSTPLIVEAGACSVRLKLQEPGAINHSPGNYLVALRSDKFEGWLPGLGNTKHTQDGLLLEVVVLARPDKKFSAVMYLPSQTLQALWPCGALGAHVRLVEPLLMPQMSDCPGQWLRDRLLKLAYMLEVRFGDGEPSRSGPLQEMLQSAGLHMVDASADSMFVGPADGGARVDDQELGYWKEEMDHGHKCAGSMDGQGRQDIPDDVLAAML